MTDVRLEIAMRVLPVLIEQNIQYQAFNQGNQHCAELAAAKMAFDYADVMLDEYEDRYPHEPPE